MLQRENGLSHGETPDTDQRPRGKPCTRTPPREHGIAGCGPESGHGLKTPGKTAQDHGFVDPHGTVEAVHKDHAEHVAEGTVRMHVGLGREPAQPRRAVQLVPFIGDHMQITVREQEQENQLGREAQPLQRIADGRGIHRRHQREERHDDGIGLDGHEQGQQHPRAADLQRPPRGDNVSARGQGDRQPKERNEHIDHGQPPEHGPHRRPAEGKEQRGHAEPEPCRLGSPHHGQAHGAHERRHQTEPGVDGVHQRAPVGKGFVKHQGRRLKYAATPISPKIQPMPPMMSRRFGPASVCSASIRLMGDSLASSAASTMRSISAGVAPPETAATGAAAEGAACPATKGGRGSRDFRSGNSDGLRGSRRSQLVGGHGPVVLVPFPGDDPDVEIVPGLAELRRHREPEHPVIIGGSLQQQRAGRCVKDLHGPLLDLLASVEPTLDLYSIPIHKGEDIHAVRRSERGSGEYEAQRHAPKAKHTHIAIPWKIAGFPGGPWQ